MSERPLTEKELQSVRVIASIMTGTYEDGSRFGGSRFHTENGDVTLPQVLWGMFSLIDNMAVLVCPTREEKKKFLELVQTKLNEFFNDKIKENS